MRDARRRSILLPIVNLEALPSHGDDGKEKGCAQRFGGEPLGVRAAQPAVLDERLTESRSRIAAELDHPPGVKRAVVRRCGGGLEKGEEFGGRRCVYGDPRVGPPAKDGVADAHSGVKSSESEFMQ